MREDTASLEVIDGHARIGVQPEDERPLGVAELLDEMERADVAEALCTHFAAVRFDGRAGNQELLGICAQEPRLHPVAVVNPAPYVGVAEEIARCAEQGFVGLRFTPGLQGWVLHSECFRRAIAATAEAGLPAIVELTGPGDASTVAQTMGEMGIPIILANVTYTTLGEAIAALQMAGHCYLEACRLATPGVVETLVSAVGAERLIYGSGAPAWHIIPTLSMIRAADIPDEAKRAILAGNARRLFKLGKARAT